MHRDFGVCSIGHDELTVVLLLHRQRRHATSPATGLWNGREPSVSATVARLLLASDNSEARAPGTILAMPCPPKADSTNAVVRRSAELAIACVANQQSDALQKQ